MAKARRVNKAAGRTVEEIRDAIRAELPVVRALDRRLAELLRELQAKPEYRRRVALISRDDDNNLPADYFDLERVWMLDVPLGGERIGGINNLRSLRGRSSSTPIPGGGPWRRPRRGRDIAGGPR